MPGVRIRAFIAFGDGASTIRVFSRLAETGRLRLMDSADRELFGVLVVMGLLLVAGIAAVLIFARVWRRERGRGRRR
jgi:hypothetical protein